MQRIAYHYMGENQFAQAEPWADAAGESDTRFGLRAAAACKEGLGHWDAAIRWMERYAERYADPRALYAWCRRTGKGDAAAASIALTAALAEPRRPG